MASEESLTFEFRAYRFIPSGRTLVSLREEAGQRQITVESYPSCCCHAWKCRDTTTTTSVSLSDNPSFRVAKERSWQWAKFLRTFFFGFLMGFLTHLIPAEFIGVEESLGSASMHARLGVVWGGLWIAWILVFLFALRQPLVAIDRDGEIIAYIPVASAAHGREVAGHLDLFLGGGKRTEDTAVAIPQQEEGGASALTTQLHPAMRPAIPPRWHVAVAFSILTALLINAIVVGVLIMECHDRGLCNY